MSKIYLICGKLCSGKSYYAKQLATREDAVILSCDELVKRILVDDLGEGHDAVLARVQAYLRDKGVELARCGCNVIFEWGFWTKVSRMAMSEHLTACGVPYEWHYIDVSDERWQANIAKRNKTANEPGSVDYYVDEGLRHKCLGLFEEPTREEVAVWVELR